MSVVPPTIILGAAIFACAVSCDGLDERFSSAVLHSGERDVSLTGIGFEETSGGWAPSGSLLVLEAKGWWLGQRILLTVTVTDLLLNPAVPGWRRGAGESLAVDRPDGGDQGLHVHVDISGWDGEAPTFRTLVLEPKGDSGVVGRLDGEVTVDFDLLLVRASQVEDFDLARYLLPTLLCPRIGDCGTMVRPIPDDAGVEELP